MFDLIAGLDLEFPDALESTFTCFVIGVSEVSGKLGEIINRSNDKALCKIYAQSEDSYKESQQKSCCLKGECSLDIGDVRHCDIDADITLDPSVAVIYRDIFGQMPASCIVNGVNFFYLFAGEEVFFMGSQDSVEWNNIAGLDCKTVD